MSNDAFISYQPLSDHEETNGFTPQKELSISQKLKWIFILMAILISGSLIYLFCFLLPSMFIPKAYPLQEISQLKHLGVSLRPVPNKLANKWAEMSEFPQRLQENLVVSSADPGSDELGDMNLKFVTEEANKIKDRLVVVGDVHGQQSELHKLLHKLEFNVASDTLLVLGDFISKGPRSIEVIDDLIDLGAKCILGNHEFYVLQHYARFHGLKGPHFENNTDESQNGIFYSQNVAKYDNDPEFLLAKKLEARHIKYINSCSTMMLMGPVPMYSNKNNGRRKSGQGLAVHAGLRWDLTLTEQKPIECLEMRSYIGPHFNETTDDANEENAVSWSKIWNEKQKNDASKEKYVVYYGHDAHRGLNLKRWAKGLDSGCTKGGSLTAMMIWQEHSGEGNVAFKENTVSVEC